MNTTDAHAPNPPAGSPLRALVAPSVPVEPQLPGVGNGPAASVVAMTSKHRILRSPDRLCSQPGGPPGVHSLGEPCGGDSCDPRTLPGLKEARGWLPGTGPHLSTQQGSRGPAHCMRWVSNPALFLLAGLGLRTLGPPAKAAAPAPWWAWPAPPPAALAASVPRPALDRPEPSCQLEDTASCPWLFPSPRPAGDPAFSSAGSLTFWCCGLNPEPAPARHSLYHRASPWPDVCRPRTQRGVGQDDPMERSASATLTKCQKPSALKNTNGSSHPPGGCKSEFEVTGPLSPPPQAPRSKRSACGFIR
ncbi:PREDICTED: uncharacterized protein LOC106148149 [Chinchilla lanigera]|uniref:uncharacterized protein LOC106148149 n=1 Tax=Chinchilla lanigera TaxID=34839 RepID=UPI000697B694|nr:PREDICTED: uncharacterized protein LOC106148149 [Chinchilla lanigera]